MEPRTVLVTDRRGFRQWLADNSATEKECFLAVCRDGCSEAITYLDAVEEALCFGWIDSTRLRSEGHDHVQRFSPRRRGSRFTQLNVARCQRMERMGLMTDAGRAAMPKEPFHIDDDIMDAILSDGDVASAITSFPELYVRVRIDNIQYLRGSDPEVFERRLRRFLDSTARGEMFGQWDDGGRLDHGPMFSLPDRRR